MTTTPSDLSPEEQAWLEEDERLRRRAHVLALRFGRDAEDLYRTIRHLNRSPEERLALGLRHARLHPDRRREDVST